MGDLFHRHQPVSLRDQHYSSSKVSPPGDISPSACGLFGCRFSRFSRCARDFRKC